MTVGSAIGAAVGAVAGGLARKGAVETVYSAAEEKFWRETYVREPYYVEGRAYEYYAPGFRAGWARRVRHDGRTFNQAESELVGAYVLAKTELDPAWHDVRLAARAAWDRAGRNLNAKR